MSNTIFHKVYNPEIFRKKGHELVDLLADHLQQTLTGKDKVICWNLPDNEYKFWTDYLENGNSDLFFQEVIKRTTHVHHPKYVGHQVAVPAPLASLSTLLSATLNNGMAVYEMGMSSSSIERVITEILCKKLGYDQTSRGFLTSGGTLANLTALLAARKAVVPFDVWTEGSRQQLGIMVSEEAHYCIDRAAKIMGLGNKGIVKIPTANDYTIDLSKLEKVYAEAQQQGILVFALVGSAPSTATGAHEDLAHLGQFCKKNKLWFHVDGAHGGATIFSKKYGHLMKGIELADSVVIDGHKMMMMPIITTALLFKKGQHSYATFSQQADYLLTESEHEDWYNLAKRTFECTKTMMSLYWFSLFKNYGEELFDTYVTSLYDLARGFAEMIEEHPCFELAVKPMSNIVCFRFLGQDQNLEQQNRLNQNIRKQLLNKGEYYLVETKLKGVHYLRTTLMNPFTTIEHLKELLSRLELVVEEVKDTA